MRTNHSHARKTAPSSTGLSESRIVRLAVGLLLVVASFGVGPARADLSDLVGKQFSARVVAVVDGDTIDVLIPRVRRVRVRVYGIDTPESKEPFSQAAEHFTRVAVFAQDVTVRGREIDQYGRLVARVVHQTADLGVGLVSAGLACHYRRFSRDPGLEAAERSARSAGRGFWSPDAIRPACVGREAVQIASDQPGRPSRVGFVANERTRLFHSASCQNASCRNCTRRFADRRQAELAGFRPARDCMKVPR
jgi:micrococcal nuclease